MNSVRNMSSQKNGDMKSNQQLTEAEEDEQIQMNINTDQMKCHYHQTKTITNFCDEQTCILPMCPECVQIHSHYHKSNNTTLDFKSIENVIHQIYDQLNEHQQLINQNNKTARNFQIIVNSNPDQLRNQLLQLKQQSVATIEQHFDNLNQKLERLLEQQNEHQSQQIEYMNQQIQKHQQIINNLIEELQEDPLSAIVKMKSERTLEYLYTQIPRTEDTTQQISQNFIEIYPNNKKVCDNISDLLNKNVFLKQNNVLVNNNENGYNLVTNSMKQSAPQNSNYQSINRNMSGQKMQDPCQLSPSKITPNNANIQNAGNNMIYSSQMPNSSAKTVRFNPHRQIVNPPNFQNSQFRQPINNNNHIIQNNNNHIMQNGNPIVQNGSQFGQNNNQFIHNNGQGFQNRMGGQNGVRNGSNPRMYNGMRH